MNEEMFLMRRIERKMEGETIWEQKVWKSAVEETRTMTVHMKKTPSESGMMHKTLLVLLCSASDLLKIDNNGLLMTEDHIGIEEVEVASKELLATSSRKSTILELHKVWMQIQEWRYYPHVLRD